MSDGRTTPVASPDGGFARTATPEETMCRIEPLLPHLGISRVADITRLDELALPTHVAYRPAGRTLAVSIGIGPGSAQSWVSAVMESLETWHAENLRPPVACRTAARELDLPYDVRSLNLARRSPLTTATTLDWVTARGVLSGATVPVPRGLVELSCTGRWDWNDVLFNVTSNGLGTGNSAEEAILHGLLEVAERDGCAPFATLPPARRRHVDPDSTGSPVVTRVLSALREAGCAVELCETTDRLGIPTFACGIWSPAVPMFFSGFGCHPDPGYAVSRAMLEAALSRLAAVSGARDDIDEARYGQADSTDPPGWPDRDLPPVAVRVVPSGGIAEAIADCAARIRAVTGTEPLVVDLTHEEVGIPVYKVVAPGLRMFGDVIAHGVGTDQGVRADHG
ncbi:YcaO-like family protein [Micromonospora sp. LOL_024]|uniref:YcaO-like family protein n=1 Tax=Micromonospora sp. LOL_024 TaxID=3345412 RepID=UPI003A85271F